MQSENCDQFVIAFEQPDSVRYFSKVSDSILVSIPVKNHGSCNFQAAIMTTRYNSICSQDIDRMNILKTVSESI